MRTQVRGAGVVASNLNVRGEEICVIDQKQSVTVLYHEYPYLIRGIADANIEIWKLCLHHVSEYHLQAFLRWCPLEALGHFGRHSRIQLHRNDLLGLLQDLRGQVSRSGTDFEDHITLLEIGLIDDPWLTLTQREYHD